MKRLRVLSLQKMSTLFGVMSRVQGPDRRVSVPRSNVMMGLSIAFLLLGVVLEIIA